ncbi:BA14K family protein [Mesorhizobium sp. SP-1A]|uniref:BA14K family protein n=1 Tax=Mesorhizobium sp. SP-1A TaxID=3077840 RepID=UPI0028F6C1CF|nr:BA14K family protein [Mesorhizobium sp. SP-1A]
MNRFLKTAILGVGVGAMSLTALSAANADDWRWRRHHHGNDAAIAGIAGLAAGALIGGAIASQPSGPAYYDDPAYDDYYDRPSYVYDRPAYVVRRAPVRVVREYYSGGLQPWTRPWYNYCANRYRSFDERSGTFIGYDGQQHFCVAN